MSVICHFVKMNDMRDIGKQSIHHQNGIDGIFNSVELHEVPESERASLENHLNDTTFKGVKDDTVFQQESESKLAQMMSQECLQDFRAVLFPDDSSANVKGNDRHQMSQASTAPGSNLLESFTDSVSSVIEKVCQKVSGNFDPRSNGEEGNGRLRKAQGSTSSGSNLMETCTDSVTSIIEKVCQEVKVKFEPSSNGEEGDQAVGELVSADSSHISYICPVCFLPFTTEKRLQYHQSRFSHGVDNNIEEKLLEEEEQQQVPMTKRPKNHQQKLVKQFKCEVCDKTLASSDYLKHHMRTHTNERPFKCTLCDKTFRQPSNLHAHMRIHTNEKPFKCKICDKAFSQSGNMHIHMAIHMDTKRFQCPTCEKCFSQNGSLRNHMKIHSGERPHVCSVCSKDFVRKSHLDAHMRTHTGEKPFICSFCNRGFSQSGDLQSHMRLHTGDLPHVCPECGKGYSAKSHLNKHMRIHSSERPFECSICGKSYNAKSTLVSHMRLHTGDRPYGCSFCERRFYSSSHLKKHIKVHHTSYFMSNEELRPRPSPRLMEIPKFFVAPLDLSSSASAMNDLHAPDGTLLGSPSEVNGSSDPDSTTLLGSLSDSDPGGTVKGKVGNDQVLVVQS